MSYLREIKNIIKFFREDKVNRDIVFYSERSVYFKYFEGVINAIFDNSEYKICYVTSDINDEIFNKSNSRLKTFYINKLLPFFIPMLNSKVLIMTMPDLNQFHIKRSNNNVNHIYVFHAPISTHMIYRKGAFDYYDTIFCVGPHHRNEIRRTEKIYNLKEKELIDVGYDLMERIYNEHLNYLQEKQEANDKKTVLIAPSWNEKNIMDTCINEIILELLDSYNVIIRPHPEYIKREKDKLEKLSKRYRRNDNFELQLDLLSNKFFHFADILITDWSGIAFEYAFATERPVLFINTPRKINNQEYTKLEIEPMEVKLRNKIGKELETSEINCINNEIKKLTDRKEEYRKQILEYREKFLFNWGKSSKIAAEYIINYCNNNS